MESIDRLVVLRPDRARGTKGPTGYALVQSGSFDTAATGGRGAVAGPMVVRIEGGHDPREDLVSGDSLVRRHWFETYQTTIELPAGPSVHRFPVPASAGRAR